MKLLFAVAVSFAMGLSSSAQGPLGTPSQMASYTSVDEDLPAANVRNVTLRLGAVEQVGGETAQWLEISVSSAVMPFRVLLLTSAWPSADLVAAQRTVKRYILQQGKKKAVEYRHAVTGEAILPSNGSWPFLMPQRAGGEGEAGLPKTVSLLGHRYVRAQFQAEDPATPPTDSMRVVNVRPDVWMGVPHDTRQKDETRRFDDSEYEYIPLTADDYETMIEAGINCFRATPENVGLLQQLGVYYWGIGGADMQYPLGLYDPLYIGPALFLNEPMVVTRDHELRPRLREDAAFRKAISPQLALDAFKKHYAEDIAEGPPTLLIKSLASREDVDLGTIDFVQPNLYSWETMVSSAAYQLLYDARTPGAIVFEPPGHVGSRRLLPGMNMNYGCQIPVTGPNNFIDIIIGFLRGAARASGKEWGISIYGSVERAEAPAFMTRAYDLGATRFFYWDSARLATVPFGEVLGTSRILSNHATQYPHRDLEQLRNAAEVAILFPSGYNLGHVYMGKGILWGITELNLERVNREGVTYRTVMSSLFTEIERCLRHGVAFDLLWDLPSVAPDGYREVVRVREDGKVEVTRGGERVLLDGPRIPERPEGAPPTIAVTASAEEGRAPFTVSVAAHVREGAAPVYYSPEADTSGVHHNEMVFWELYGPGEEDYTCRPPVIRRGDVAPHPDGGHAVKAEIRIDAPGTYRLRAATTDLAGRSAVAWQEIVVN